MSSNLPSPPKTVAPPILPPGAGGPLPPNVTPGWNDPPELSACSPSTKPKRLLNKRVSFPMTQSQSPQPQTTTNTSINDTAFHEIVNNFTLTVTQLSNSAMLVKDLDRMAIHWNDIAGSQIVKELLLQASRHVQNSDVAQARNMHKQLSMIPAAGWFTLFLHSIITALSLENNQ